MIFTEMPLKGAYIIDPEKHEDERGFFARIWCESELAEHGLETRLAQCSVSSSRRKGTLRGMHYQTEPHAEAKIIRCTSGAIYDVIIDLRPQSPTYRRWMSIELTADSHRMVYIPEGFAHGFQTLSDHTEVCYQISAPYKPSAARGVRWDDPAFGIVWPVDERTMSVRDRGFPDFLG